MMLSVPNLRRGLFLAAVVLALAIGGMYFYARWKVRNVVREIPAKMGINIQQSAEGFTVSKSDHGRTIFTIRASRAVQLKVGGRAELHNVSILLYGRDASRFDQISGDEFDYDPKSGDVSARGDVLIDLEANPMGLLNPDQAPPKELKNPVHLKTSGLVFNQKSGNAFTKEKIELTMPQAAGSAVGATYLAKNNTLTLQSQVEIDATGQQKVHITAGRGTITKEPRQIVLEEPRVHSDQREFLAKQATIYLRDDNTVDHLLATGDVQAEMPGTTRIHATAKQADILLNDHGDALRQAVLTGDVRLDASGRQVAHATAGRVALEFAGKHDLQMVHASQGVTLLQQPPAEPGKTSQNTEIAAPAMDFIMAKGHLDRAITFGPPQITISQPGNNQRTVLTAGSFEARFDQHNHLHTLHGSPDARITTLTPGQPERVSTSASLDLAFRTTGGVDHVVQQGNLAYVDGTRKAWADLARYTPADQVLVLSGSPRVADTGMSTTALLLRINRVTGEAIAEGDVKSTYSELKTQPDGALLASSDPIHVTANHLTASRSPSIALYTGNARLWQNANVVAAPTLEFDRDRRSITAQGGSQPVSTVLVQTGKDGKVTSVTISSARLTYTDAERQIHLEGGVTAKTADSIITCRTMDVYLMAHAQGGSAAGRLDHLVAKDQVVITQPARRATGDQLTYTASEDKFVLTGGNPSIFDAEHGKITGNSLTFFRHDDRVLVEGDKSAPSVTTTRVAR